MGNIRVESSISRTFPPDVVYFGIHIGKVAPTSAELSGYSKTVIDAIIEGIEELDIDEERLEETYFRISVNRELVDGKYVDNGFLLDSGYTISSYIDYELMEGIRDMLTDLGIEYTVSYGLEDESEIRHGLLAEAVKSSRLKASIIASAADREVGEMVSVDYSDTGRCTGARLLACQNSDAKPHDIDIRESVVVEWAIE